MFELLERTIGIRSRLGQGECLIDFLKTAVGNAPRGVQIAVTGHSKGGALAPALALWLAETQGEGQPGEEKWDPNEKATVHCWAFAGPSPGNPAFSARFNRHFDPEKTPKKSRFRAVVNPIDLVPHAWEQEHLAKLPGLYGERAPCNPAILTLIRLMQHRVEEMATRNAKVVYQDLSPTPVLCRGVNLDQDDYLAQVAHHHLDGYFQGAGLHHRMGDFFILLE